MPGMLTAWKPRVPRGVSTTARFGGQIRLPTDFIQSIGYVLYPVVREPTGHKNGILCSDLDLPWR
jgi:hypothetical protein